MHTKFSVRKPERSDYLGDLSVGRTIILKRILNSCIYLCLGTIRCETLVNVVMNVGFPLRTGISLPAERLSVNQKGLLSTWL
jgi:hypothetical protein